MRVTVTGASGLIGSALVASLRAGDVDVTVLSRDGARAGAKLGVPAFSWDPMAEPAPAQALTGRNVIIHLAGESISQRWSEAGKRRIHESRVIGTRNLIEGLRGLDSPPQTLVSGSAIGYYGARGSEPLDEDARPGDDFLAQTCVAWEAEAHAATQLGLRVVQIRTGVVLHRAGGALAKMLPPFRLGVGGPVAGGRQYVSWIHRDDLVALLIAAARLPGFSGPVNGTAPVPVTNAELSRSLGRALHRPSALPVPGGALRLLYGEMAELITSGARVLPAKALVLGHRFLHAEIDEALQSALG